MVKYGMSGSRKSGLRKTYALLAIFVVLWGGGTAVLGAPEVNAVEGNVASRTQSSESPSAMTIMADNSYPADARIDLTTVAGEVLAVVRQRLSGPPPAGARSIVCIYSPSVPEVSPTGELTPYMIKTSVNERNYDQFAFQLAHELGHVMFDPRRTNGLVETCAVAISLQALDDLSMKWATDPPYEIWRPYAPNFSDYRALNEQNGLADFPDEVKAAVKDKRWKEVSLYLRYRRQDQDDNYIDRGLNCLGAVMLRSQPISWSDMVGLASHTVPPTSASPRFRDNLQIDLVSLPPSIQTLFHSLGRGCTTAMAAAHFQTKPQVPVLANTFLFQEKGSWVWLAECKAADRGKYDGTIHALKPEHYTWDQGDKVVQNMTP